MVGLVLSVVVFTDVKNLEMVLFTRWAGYCSLLKRSFKPARILWRSTPKRRIVHRLGSALFLYKYSFVPEVGMALVMQKKAWVR